MKRIAYSTMVQESVVRGVAFWVILLSVSGAVLGGVWIPLFLAADFTLRGILHPRYSPLSLLSKTLSSRLFLRGDKKIFFTPKRFAAKIGLLLSLAAAAFFLTGLSIAATGTLLLLATFSFLECVLRFCAGCKIFGFLARHNLVDTSDCPNCVY